MRLSHIALRNMRRHWTRTLMLAVLITSVVAVVASLYFVNRSADGDLANKVDEYGANITVLPSSQELPLTYGGVRLGGLTYDAKPLTMDEVALIRTIKNRANVNRVAPKLLELGQVQEKDVILLRTGGAQDPGHMELLPAKLEGGAGLFAQAGGRPRA